MKRPWLRAFAVLAVVVAPLALYLWLVRTADPPAARAAAPAPSGPVQLYVAPGGSDAGRCSQSHPCATLGAAYRNARAGTTDVTIEAGHYPVQTIESPPTANAARPGLVSFAPAGGAEVELDELVVDAPHVRVSGVHTAGWTILGNGTHVTLRNVISTAAVFVTSARDVKILGGSVSSTGRPVVNGSEIKAAEGSSTPPRNVLFDGVSFFDFLRAPGSSDHVDCLHVMAADGLIVRRSRFWNCEAFDILFTVFGDAGSPRNVLLENNFFECCHSGYYSVQLGGDHGEQWSDFELRNNTSNTSFSVESELTGPVRFIGNLAPGVAGPCRAQITMDWNVWTHGPRCGKHDRIARARFERTGSGDLHLVGCPAAVGRADPEDSPSIDIDGERRPIGRRPDAGADEAAGCSSLTPAHPRVAHSGQPEPLLCGRTVLAVSAGACQESAGTCTSASRLANGRASRSWAVPAPEKDRNVAP